MFPSDLSEIPSQVSPAMWRHSVKALKNINNLDKINLCKRNSREMYGIASMNKMQIYLEQQMTIFRRNVRRNFLKEHNPKRMPDVYPNAQTFP